VKYILIMNASKSGWGTFLTWPKASLQAHIAFMVEFDQVLRKAGVLVSAEGLAGPAEAKVVRAAKDGTPIVEAVFPETKEYLAGYWIVEVASAEKAYEIAAQASAAPGPGGTPLNMPIEVRQVMSGPPEDLR
jgi:hypothetical protein